MNTVRSGLHAPAHLRLFLLVAAVAAAAVFGCSEKSEPEPAAPVVTPAEAIELSKSAMANLSSFRFQLTHDSGVTSLSGGLKLTRAGGTVAQNGLDLEAEAKIGRAFVRTSAVVIDDRTWMTNVLTGVWSEIPPEESPFSFLDPVKLVADILGETQQPVFPENPLVNGELIIDGKIPATTLAALVGLVEPNAIPSVTLSLDAESHLLKKIVITGIAQPEDDAETTRVITLSEFDKPVTLEPPI